jgi:protein PhnA
MAHHRGTCMETKDAFGNILNTGDTVKLTKDLKVAGSSVTLKGRLSVKKIRLTDNSGEIDGKIDGMKITLKTCFVKKA